MTILKTGDKAPAFTMTSDKGEKISLSSFKGEPLVLYFYPKDDTPGCTTEACDFRDNIKKFEKLDCAVAGISKDSPETHAKFRDKYKLSFPLLSDADGSVCEKYGVWVEKSMYGKKYMGIERATFLIDGKGVIREIWRKVKVAGHADAVLEALRAL